MQGQMQLIITDHKVLLNNRRGAHGRTLSAIWWYGSIIPSQINSQTYGGFGAVVHAAGDYRPLFMSLNYLVVNELKEGCPEVKL